MSKRIAKDFAECTANPPDGVTVRLASEGDMTVWNVTLRGPADTVYDGGQFGVRVVLRDNYPFKAPAVCFTTRIYHPNVTNDAAGSICLSMLKTDNWKPVFSVRSVLEAVRNLLAEPNPDDPLEAQIADQYRSDRAAFDKTARTAVSTYASGPPVFPALPA